MGKREVRVIVVRKGTTIALLILVSVAMAALLYSLSGKAYTSESEPLRDLLLRTLQPRHPVTRDAVLAGSMAAIANILFFMPWGFLMFLFLDAPTRSRGRTYLVTVLAGAIFALAMVLWQNFLPTRVTGLPDALANAFGALAGAMAGHVRKRVHVQFND
ncbi:MAG: VanZ family protein [Thermoanaerobaculia bacterium]